MITRTILKYKLRVTCCGLTSRQTHWPRLTLHQAHRSDPVVPAQAGLVDFKYDQYG